ncbi:MAG TPA: ester cyclase [Tepidisphaeraceae bacterium]|jgi:predicted ester cyclase|nr:ester cyclase [Tepidisphaeraceae bacterium]
MPPTSSNTSADNKANTIRWFEEVWNQRRDQTITELLTPNSLPHGLGDLLPGPDGFRPFHRKMLAAFPDLKVEIHQTIGEADLTAIRFSMRATHTGDTLGFPATNRPVLTHGLCLVRWENGKIVESWNEFDSAGVIPALATPA